jgi:hypothetical protein
MVLTVVFAAVSVRHARSRSAGVVLRIDTSKDANVPLTVVNAGHEPVFALEATLRFEGRAPRPQQVMERHRRALVLLPGERLAFPFPEDMASRKVDEHATLVRRVRLDAVARDSRGRPVEEHDVLEDPMAWIESERRSRSAVHTGPPRIDDR